MTDHRDQNACEAAPRPEALEATAQTPAEKRPFVEPAVSVPADVLEATALFQAPTVQTSVA